MVYDKPVTLQVQDAQSERWNDVMKLHARVNKTGGGQSLSADADQYQVRLNFDLRYSSVLEQIAYGGAALSAAVPGAQVQNRGLR